MEKPRKKYISHIKINENFEVTSDDEEHPNENDTKFLS